MYLNRNKLTLSLILLLSFMTLLSCGATRAFAADDCGSAGGPGAPPQLGGKCVGGFNCGPDNQFTKNYQGSAQKAVQKKAAARWNAHMMSDTIDAKVHYCWTAMKATFLTLMTSEAGLNPKGLIIIALHAALNALLAQVCTAVLTIVAGAVASIISAFNSLLCLPIPRLQLPGFALPAFGRGNCPGGTMALFTNLPPGIGGGQKDVYWKLFGAGTNQRQ
ncbi:MAG: hypothetical protein M3N08_02500 [Pseudomonadota bacterium]|nr:hypothetical protein [Pseudomonadota bacterium]